MVDIKYKLLEGGVAPIKATTDAAGFDLSVREVVYTQTYTAYKTGVQVEIPQGYVGLLFPRSSVSKTGYALANSVGVIDSDFRGEIEARFYKVSDGEVMFPYMKGERCCQLIIIPIPNINFVQVDELNSTDRGEGGFGSTNV